MGVHDILVMFSHVYSYLQNFLDKGMLKKAEEKWLRYNQTPGEQLFRGFQIMDQIVKPPGEGGEGGSKQWVTLTKEGKKVFIGDETPALAIGPLKYLIPSKKEEVPLAHFIAQLQQTKWSIEVIGPIVFHGKVTKVPVIRPRMAGHEKASLRWYLYAINQSSTEKLDFRFQPGPFTDDIEILAVYLDNLTEMQACFGLLAMNFPHDADELLRDFATIMSMDTILNVLCRLNNAAGAMIQSHTCLEKDYIEYLMCGLGVRVEDIPPYDVLAAFMQDLAFNTDRHQKALHEFKDLIMQKWNEKALRKKEIEDLKAMGNEHVSRAMESLDLVDNGALIGDTPVPEGEN